MPVRPKAKPAREEPEVEIEEPEEDEPEEEEPQEPAEGVRGAVPSPVPSGSGTAGDQGDAPPKKKVKFPWDILSGR